MNTDIRTQKPQELRRSRREIQVQLNVLNSVSTGCSFAASAKPLRLLRSAVSEGDRNEGGHPYAEAAKTAQKPQRNPGSVECPEFSFNWVFFCGFCETFAASAFGCFGRRPQ